MNDNAWIEELSQACDAHGQAEVARRLQRAGDGKYPSPAVVNQAVKGSYRGDMNRLKAVVEGVLMSRTVECPVIGDLPRQRCIEYQSRNFAATNPLRVQLARVCPNCDQRR